jgi:uncharacterized GH25 family protein
MDRITQRFLNPRWFMRSFITFLVVITMPIAAYAHDMWLEPQAGGFALLYGHHGGETLVIDGQKVKAIRCARAGATVSDLLKSAALTPKKITVRGSCDAVSAFFYGGFFSLTPDGEKSLPKSKCPDAVKSWESKQFAKWVDSRSAQAGKPVGDEFEIVPVTDLSKVKQGDKATFRVLLWGKPVSGVTVAIDHKPLGETDSAGEVRVRIRATDVESISASIKKPLRSADADARVFEATLSFKVAR